VLFERRLQEGLRDGSIRLAFRRWRRPQVVAGRRYRSPIGMVLVARVCLVSDEVPEVDAHAAGYASSAEPMRELKGASDGTLYRLELRRDEAPDPRSVLAQDGALDEQQLRGLRARLARLDAAQGRTWTVETLQAIQAQPGRRAGDLAQELGWDELRMFKLQVRKLKALGLTESLRIGYRLSPRGRALLQRQHI
jgi:hypothetical protein